MIGAVAGELRRVLAALPIRALVGARQEIQSSYLRWHRATRGSARQDPLDALTEMRVARGLVDEAVARLQKAREGIGAYASHIEGVAARPPPVPDTGSVHSPPSMAFDPTPHLPPPAPPRTPGDRTKTRGNYVRGDRVEELVSGEHDRFSAQVNQHARRLGLVGPDGGLRAAADVELRFAMRMREEDIRSAIILINREPCKGRYGCDDLLERFLPPGATLTVYWSDREAGWRQKTYRGGEHG
ncbi:DddA-like double-stranded DNA deaminase toxin [Plantactinospora sp. WMMC1484]|uniref:DddA-like double-stranded DNA deaminase toxin n=1 Tax=Plantactinospora sp. WMMC1484 TaxID=3404122 RepID=UPI003BF61ADC